MVTQRWRLMRYLLVWIGIGLWAGAGFIYFFIALGRPPRLFALGLSVFLGVGGLLAFAAVALIARRGRARTTQQVSRDPLKQAALKRSVMWNLGGCLLLLFGLAWALFAVNEWAGLRGRLLAVSGVFVAVGFSSAASIPFVKAVGPRRRPLGMTYLQFTYVSVIAAFLCGLVLALIAITFPSSA